MLYILVSATSFAIADEKWNINEVEEKLHSENGHKEVLQQYYRDKDLLMSKNPALYHYLEGIHHIDENNLQKATDNFQEALTISHSEERTDIEVATIKQLVFLSSFYGDSGSLIEFGSRLEEIAERTEDAETQMYAYNVIALSFYYLANDNKVIEYLERMLLLANEHDNKYFQAIYKTIHGDILLSYEESEEALKLFETADQLFEMVEGTIVKDLKKMNKGSLLLAKSKLSERYDSRVVLKEMEQLIHETTNQYHHVVKLGFLYNRKGLIELEYDLNQNAVDSLEKSKELFGKMINTGPIGPIRYATMSLAQAYYKNGDYKQAADSYMSVSKMDEDPQIFMYFDEMTTKVRNFTEKELNNQIQTLTELKKTQNKAIVLHRLMIVAFIFGMIAATIAFIITKREHNKVNELKNTLYFQSITDGLTDVYNRKKIFEILQAQKEVCFVALVDIDNFKSINDTYGYLFGDEVIKKVVQTIKAEIRKEDEIGRYGGEEFLLILRNIDLDEAISLFERIRKNVEELQWEYEGFKTTICIGATKKLDSEGEEVFRLVDSLVHEAKRTGKNKVICK